MSSSAKMVRVRAVTDDALLRSPLHDRHAAAGAKFAEFGGWEMPLQFTGVVDEHTAVRERVGVFDVSHLGNATVTGPGARQFVDSCLTNALDKIHPGKAQYTLCCDDATGGVVDDLIVYLRADDDVLLVPNAANTAEVVARLVAAAPAEVTVTNVHRDYAVFALQGPASDVVMETIGLPVLDEYMSFTDVDWNENSVTVCRSGYTGERGYELIVGVDGAGALWDAVLDAGEASGIARCGLGARDTLRTEMGYPLHGQDLTMDITPVQGRSGWAVGWKKPAFWAREVLVAEREEGPRRRLRGIIAAGRGIPRPGMDVMAEGSTVGTVTSGTFSPTLKKGIGLALIPPDIADGTTVTVDVRGRSEEFEVVNPPFVEPSTR
jgi:aminomethyltransferase